MVIKDLKNVFPNLKQNSTVVFLKKQLNPTNVATDAAAPHSGIEFELSITFPILIIDAIVFMFCLCGIMAIESFNNIICLLFPLQTVNLQLD